MSLDKEELSPCARYIVDQFYTRMKHKFYGLIIVNSGEDLININTEVLNFLNKEETIVKCDRFSNLFFPTVGGFFLMSVYCQLDKDLDAIMGKKFSSVALTSPVWRKTNQYTESFLKSRINEYSAIEPQLVIIDN